MKLIFLGLLFVVLIQSGSSLRCYVCTTAADNCIENPTDCSDKFMKNGCFKLWGKKDGHIMVMKSCLPNPNNANQCESYTQDGVKGTGCMCTTDLCNGAKVPAMNMIFTFSLIFLATFVWKLM